MKATEDELSVKTSALHETERTLSDKEAEMAQLVSDLGDRTATADSQRVEADRAARRRSRRCKIRIGDYERDIKKTDDRLDTRARGRRGGDPRTSATSAARSKISASASAQLEQQLVAQTTEAEVARQARCRSSSAASPTRAACWSEREYECDQLRDRARRTRGGPNPTCAQELSDEPAASNRDATAEPDRGKGL